MSIGSYIKQLREEKGMTQEQLGEKLGVKKAAVQKWEAGTVVNLKRKTIQQLSDIFNVPPHTFFSDEKFPIPQIANKTVTFPVIGTIAAGYEHIAIESWSGETVEIPVSYLKGKRRDEFIVLSVCGDSMYPLYQNGDKVLILKQSTLNRSGDIGAILYDDEKTTLKKIEYVQGENWLKLLPINPTYQPETIEGEELEHCRVIGIPKLLVREID